MSSTQQAKVIIAGGSVAGLTLANILERIGVDYLLLEKYGKIAPDLGASIGIFPNGFRILDQLGCYSAITDLVEGADGFETLGMRNEKGESIQLIEQASTHIKQRVAYAPIFVDRQMIIQILYDNIQDKSKILTSKGVKEVRQYSDSVRVGTSDGSVFTGEILVGADGIHSTVRREMWRLADESLQDHLFPASERTQAPTEYCCIFGISKPNSKFPDHSSQNVLGNTHSYLIASGPNRRIYWFLFKKLPKITYGLYDKIPKFTEEERDALAAEHTNDPITEDLRFGELYANRTTATLQALPEIVFSRWHYRRIITIGDAAHKFNPIGGQGGNSAIEDAAVLSNQLYNLLKTNPSSAFSETSLTKVFETMQSIRHERATGFMKRSHELQSMQAQDTFAMKLVAKYVIPGSSSDSTLELFSQMARPAARLDMMDLPKREHVELYYDERVAKPIESKIPRYIAFAIFSLLSLAVVANLRIPGMPIPSPTAKVQSITGMKPVDAVLGHVAQDFAESISWADAGHTLLFFYRLMFLAPVLLIWYIEGNRHGSRRSIISWPSVFGLAMHAHSIALIAPLSFLSHIWVTGGAQSTLGRCIHANVAKSIGPAIFLGYVLPTTLLFIPSVSSVYGMHLITAWLFAPISVSIILALVPRVLDQASKKPNAKDTDSAFAHYRNADVPALRSTYEIAFAASLIYHTTTILVLFLQGAGSGHPPVLLPPRFLLPSSSFPAALSTPLFVFLKRDLFYAVVAVALFGLYNVFELRAKGLVTSFMALVAAAIFLGAQAVVGPGAALVGLWWWREGVVVGGAGSVREEGGKRAGKA